MKDFAKLASQIKREWSDEEQRVYEAAAAQYRQEFEHRAELGAVLSTARKSASLTQTQLAELSGIQQAEISRIERGLANPTADTLLRLTNALGRKLTLA